MRQEDKLKEMAGTRVPYTVPEGYFKSFKDRMMSSLPEYPEKPKHKDLTVWQRVKPYVYLAAMFAGIWCMMQIFHNVSTSQQSHPDDYAMAMYEPDSFDLYIDEASGQDLELQDEVLNLYSNLDELKRDLYAQL